MNEASMMNEADVNVAELFAGIGGMHFALDEARVGLKTRVVKAFDISDVPNRVYRHNFPDTCHGQANICGLSAKELVRLQVTCILMSPPCQPFTRQGCQRDDGDARTQPLLHLIDNVLAGVDGLRYILLENVRGFERSKTRKLLVDKLKALGFSIKEFLISPTQIGVPNSRLRYYLLAKKGTFSNSPCNQEITTHVTDLLQAQDTPNGSRTIGDYLDAAAEDLTEFELSDKVLLKHAELLDIVQRHSDRSCCFTKAYGRYVEGTGSVIQQSGDLSAAYEKFRSQDCSREDKILALNSLKLRYFTPREVSRLLGFPASFSFPEDMSLMQKYRVLGNSLNVKVVSLLLQELFRK